MIIIPILRARVPRFNSSSYSYRKGHTIYTDSVSQIMLHSSALFKHLITYLISG